MREPFADVLVGALASMTGRLPGVLPVALPLAPTGPLAVIRLGATLGVAQVARALARRAAARRVQTLSPAPEVAGPARSESPGAKEAAPHAHFTP